MARAFAGRPDVVFADEPTGNLDSRSGEEVLGLLGRAVRRTARTVVMVTHDPVAAAHADEVVFLADGRLVDRMESPTADKVLDRLKAFEVPVMNASVRLSVSSLRAHKRRFAGTFLAVFLGVAFLAGTLVMGDTLRASFDTMFGNATSGTDAVVRSADTITTPGESQGIRQPRRHRPGRDRRRRSRVSRPPRPTSRARASSSARTASPSAARARPPSPATGSTDPKLNPYQLAEGRAPQKSGEVVVNRGAAEKGDLKIGDTTTLRTPDPVKVTIVGLATFGGEDGMAQVTFTGMTQADAEKYLTAEARRGGEHPGAGRARRRASRSSSTR